MGDHEQIERPWWRRVLDKIEGREPVVIRGAITLVVAVAAIWGVDLTDVGERLENTLDAVGGFVILLGLGWQRAGAVPAKEVLVSVRPNGDTVAGPASVLPTGMVLEAED